LEIISEMLFYLRLKKTITPIEIWRRFPVDFGVHYPSADIFLLEMHLDLFELEC